MLSRSGMLGKTLVRQTPILASTPVRGMATEQQLKARIKSVGNIGKITKAMKMVSAAKLRRSQLNLENARIFSADMDTIWPDPKVEENPSKYLLVACASDKGLCGAINSAIIRDVKNKMSDPSVNGCDKSLIMFGDKARLGLERLYKQHFKVVYTDVAKLRDRSFDQAALCAEELLKQDFDRGELVFNYFKSLLSYETTTVPLFSFKQTLKNKAALKYKIVGGRSADVLQSLHEFRTATRLFGWFAESDTSELSARMNAMGNSSKNAGEMLDALTLLYNRKRQSKITTELIEIISGASAAEEQQDA